MPTIGQAEVRRLTRRLARLAYGPDPNGGPDGQILPTAGSQDTLSTAYRSGWRGVPCVFVLSTGRVGTVALTRLLDLSPQIYALHEPSPALLMASRHAYQAGDTQTKEPERWDLVIDAARAEMVWHAHRMRQVYAETNNRMTFLAPTLARFFPESKFVLLHRDPVEFVQSVVRRGTYGSNSWDDYRISPLPSDPHAGSWDAMTQAQKAAWLWRATHEFSLEFLDTLPDTRKLTVPSRDLFSGNMAAIEAIFHLAGVEVPPRKKIDGTLARRWNEGKANGAGAASGLQPDDIAAVDGLVRDVASRLGYAR